MKSELLKVLTDCIEFCGEQQFNAQKPYWEEYGKDMPDEKLWEANETACAGCEMNCPNGNGENDCIMKALGCDYPWDLYCKLFPFLEQEKK